MTISCEEHHAAGVGWSGPATWCLHGQHWEGQEGGGADVEQQLHEEGARVDNTALHSNKAE
jgi:hypothetical protein